jgi:hypothetical protein
MTVARRTAPRALAGIALLLGGAAAGCRAPEPGVVVDLPLILTRVSRRADGGFREFLVLGTGLLRGRDSNDPSGGLFVLGVGGMGRFDEPRAIRIVSFLPLFGLCAVRVEEAGGREASFLASWPLLSVVGSFRSIPGPGGGGAGFRSVPLATSVWSFREGGRRSRGVVSLPLLSAWVVEGDVSADRPDDGASSRTNSLGEDPGTVPAANISPFPQ